MTINATLRSLGLVYCVSFLICAASCSAVLWLYWDSWKSDRTIPLLADVFSVSAGISLLVIISWEGVRYMVLAAMKARELVEQGRQEGRQEERERFNKAFEQFGTEINGVLTLQLTPEVQRFLAGEDQ